jgi:hypothetical protein
MIEVFLPAVAMSLFDRLRHLAIWWMPAAEPATASNSGNCGDRLTVRHRQRMRTAFLTWPARSALPPLTCRAQDISIRGACLEPHGALPEDGAWALGARVYFSGDDHERECRLAWQKGEMIGVHFEGRPHPLSRSYS